MLFTSLFLTFLIFNEAFSQDLVDTLNGRYTSSIKNYKLIIPHRKTATGDFHSFHLPSFFEFDFTRQEKRRKKRSLDNADRSLESIHYGIDLNDESYHIELLPNHDFLSPNLVFEQFDRDTKVQDKKLRTLKDKKLCHYVGKLRGEEKSRAAISTCDGLSGHIIKDGKIYYIEPVDEHTANSKGHHLHLIFEDERVSPHHSMPTCGVTNEKWLEGWKSSFKNQMLHGGVKQKRGSVSVYRYIETMTVCDKKFLMHHKARDVENYVLTLMNMMFDLYHDASVGAQIDVVLLRVIYLEKEDREVDLKINTDASASLDSFCQWQKHLNTENGDPNHHDLAMLLTRHDLCDVENANNCGLVGLAFVSEICTQNKQCAINEDTGIMVAITATHELGHLLGCNHDEQGDTPCAGIDPEDGSTYIMHPMGTFFSYKWSTCSRGFISSLFESNLGECLNNEPKPTLYPYKNALPGVMYNAKEQCHLLMPETDDSCDLDNVEFCEQLWCKKQGQCVSDGNGPADGTKCGENKWCFRKKCVETGERPKSVDGGWGEWGEFSTCSRSCGGGVSVAERFCDHPPPENRGLYCLGDRKKIKICNTDTCPQDTPSFRQIQCLEWNHKDFMGAKYKWEVYNGKIDKEPCSLYCINEKNSFSKLGPAKDGTPCKMGTKNMCVQGDCKKVGCDWELESDAVEDMCGVCNGDGTQCRIVDEVNNEVLGKGYQKIAIIPTGARNILIEELKPSVNIIAIADRTEKKFYLNGKNTEQLDGPYKFGKSDGIYSHPQSKQEKLVIHGPLYEDLVFMVSFYKHENVGYRYKYAEMTPDSSYTPSYHWELTDFGPCSVKCGGGTKTAEFNCIESKAGKVSANFCTGIDKPNGGTQNCNEEPCKTEWRTGKWGPCRACKHKGGVRTRQVECVKENPKPGGDVILEEDNQCEGPKPGTYEMCETKEVCADKGKRFSAGIPERFRRDIWSQINRKSANPYIEKTNTKISKRSHEKKNLCENKLTLRDKRNNPKSSPQNKNSIPAESKIANSLDEDLNQEGSEDFIRFGPFSDQAFQVLNEFAAVAEDPIRLKREKQSITKRNNFIDLNHITDNEFQDIGNNIDDQSNEEFTEENIAEGLSNAIESKTNHYGSNKIMSMKDKNKNVKEDKNGVSSLLEDSNDNKNSVSADRENRIISYNMDESNNLDNKIKREDAKEETLDENSINKKIEREARQEKEEETEECTPETTPCPEISSDNSGIDLSQDTTIVESSSYLMVPDIDLGAVDRMLNSIEPNQSSSQTASIKVSVNNSQKGKVVLDKVPNSKKKVMIIDLTNPNPKNRNISDKMFQSMGDEVRKDVSIKTHRKVLTGDAAAKELERLSKYWNISTTLTTKEKQEEKP